MKTTQEMVFVLFDNETIQKVKELIKSGVKKTPLNKRNMNFGLIMTESNTINLEVMCRDNNGLFSKVIGYYDVLKYLNSGNLIVTLLKEYEPDYNELISSGLISINGITVQFMSIRESGVIAAFSRETVETVKEMYFKKENDTAKEVSKEIAELLGPFPHLQTMKLDRKLMSNGLKIELLFSLDGFPQCFLDDEYEINGGFAAYIKEGAKINLHPMVEHANSFDKFLKMQLLSAFKGMYR